MLISIILPCHNEEDNLDELHSRIRAVMESVGEPYELIYVDDGSTDTTLNTLREFCRTDRHCRVLEFSRNFGHQQAIAAGLDHARGDAVIMMDSDLQHPPELIPALVGKWKEGYEIVYTVRKDPPGTSLFKRMTARVFYKVINALTHTHIPENSADFRLLDKKVVDQLRLLEEKTKFFRGLISWVGYKQCALSYEASPRYAGRSKYSLLKMMKLAYDGITSFSAFPLHIATALGMVVSLFSFIYAVYAIYARFYTNTTLPGWTSVLVAVLFLGGVQLISLGLVGGYLGKVYEQLKRRPSYIIRDIIDHTTDVPDE